MQNRMPTRRCTKQKVPCQEIENIFYKPKGKQTESIPKQILQSIPKTQKVSCQAILRTKEFTVPSNFPQALQAIHENLQNMKESFDLEVKVNYEKEESEQKVEKEGQKEDESFGQLKRQTQINDFDGIQKISKRVKRDTVTKESFEENNECLLDLMFEDPKAMHQLDAYLSID